MNESCSAAAAGSGVLGCRLGALLSWFREGQLVQIAYLPGGAPWEERG